MAQLFEYTYLHKDLSFIQVTDEDRWLPPESLLLVDHDARSDIWSLGATMIELFTQGKKYHINTNKPSSFKVCFLLGIPPFDNTEDENIKAYVTAGMPLTKHDALSTKV